MTIVNGNPALSRNCEVVKLSFCQIIVPCRNNSGASRIRDCLIKAKYIRDELARPPAHFNLNLLPSEREGAEYVYALSMPALLF